MKEMLCNHVRLGHPHTGHRWEMQPGMESVHCPGHFGLPTGCRSTKHCAYWGWCQRCNPELADAGSHVRQALAAIGHRGDSELYGRVMAVLASSSGVPG